MNINFEQEKLVKAIAQSLVDRCEEDQSLIYSDRLNLRNLLVGGAKQYTVYDSQNIEKGRSKLTQLEKIIVNFFEDFVQETKSITWFGRLALALDIHPTISSELTKTMYDVPEGLANKIMPLAKHDEMTPANINDIPDLTVYSNDGKPPQKIQDIIRNGPQKPGQANKNSDRER